MTIYPTDFLNEIDVMLSASIQELKNAASIAPSHTGNCYPEHRKPLCTRCLINHSVQTLIDIKVNLECGVIP
jgi:hypothetical protein